MEFPDFSLKLSILNFMDIHPVGATLKYEDGQKNMIKVTVTFHDYLEEVYTRAVFKYLKINR